MKCKKSNFQNVFSIYFLLLVFIAEITVSVTFKKRVIFRNLLCTACGIIITMRTICNVKKSCYWRSRCLSWELLRVIKRSKFVLNVLIWFKCVTEEISLDLLKFKYIQIQKERFVRYSNISWMNIILR